jgi:hypothetical protein
VSTIRLRQHATGPLLLRLGRPPPPLLLLAGAGDGICPGGEFGLYQGIEVTTAWGRRCSPTLQTHSADNLQVMLPPLVLRPSPPLPPPLYNRLSRCSTGDLSEQGPYLEPQGRVPGQG